MLNTTLQNNVKYPKESSKASISKSRTEICFG